MIGLNACKKADFVGGNDAASAFNAGATVVIKSGTVSVTTPDTTYNFTAPGDQITFSGDSTYYNITCYRNKYTSFTIISPAGAKVGGTSPISEFHFYGLYQNVSQVYNSTNANSQAGTLAVTNFFTNGYAISGTFSSHVAKTFNGSQANAQYYNITGSFNLNIPQ